MVFREEGRVMVVAVDVIMDWYPEEEDDAHNRSAIKAAPSKAKHKNTNLVVLCFPVAATPLTVTVTITTSSSPFPLRSRR